MVNDYPALALLCTLPVWIVAITFCVVSLILRARRGR